MLGLSSGGSELQPYVPTQNIHSASISGLTLHHGDSIYVTVSCTNSIDLTQEVTSAGLLVISEPPSSDDAYLVFHPQPLTAFLPMNSVQAEKDVAYFNFHGFTDNTGIKVSKCIFDLDILGHFIITLFINYEITTTLTNYHT